jgi:hypothetical protein
LGTVTLWVHRCVRTADDPELAKRLEATYVAKYSMDTWPFRDDQKRLSRAERLKWLRVKAHVTDAVIAQLSEEFTCLELKLMLTIVSRTLGWCKPWEGIPHSHALEGVFYRGRRLHAPIAANKTHLNEAVDSLAKKRYIRVGQAQGRNGLVRIFALNVEVILNRAHVLATTSRRSLNAVNRYLAGT